MSHVPCPTRESTRRSLASYLGAVGRWRWLAALLADARIGAWIPVPALRLAWVAFVLTVPGVLSAWTVLFVLRRLAGRFGPAAAVRAWLETALRDADELRAPLPTTPRAAVFALTATRT